MASTAGVYFPTVREAEIDIKVLEWTDFWCELSSWLKCVPIFGGVGERERERKRINKLSGVTSYESCYPMTSSNSNCLTKAPSPNFITSGLKIQHMNFGG